MAVSSPTVKPREDTDDTILENDERTLISVLRATKDVQDWSLLALLLGVNERDYNSIMKETRDVTGQRKAIIKKWLETGKASWAILVSGLKDELIGLGAIGNKIAKDHPRFVGSHEQEEEEELCEIEADEKSAKEVKRKASDRAESDSPVSKKQHEDQDTTEFEVDMKYSIEFQMMRNELGILCMNTLSLLEEKEVEMSSFTFKLSLSFPELKDDLKKCRSLPEAMAEVIRPRVSLIQIDYLEVIYENFALPRASIDAYIESIESFCNRMTVEHAYGQDLMDEFALHISKLESIAFTLDWEGDEHSLKDLLGLFKKLVRQYSKRVKVKVVFPKKSFVVECYVPSHLQSLIVRMIQQNEKILHEEKVLSVTAGGVTVFTKASQVSKSSIEVFMEDTNKVSDDRDDISASDRSESDSTDSEDQYKDEDSTEYETLMTDQVLDQVTGIEAIIFRSRDHEFLKSHHGDICDVLSRSEETLIMFSGMLYGKRIIDVHTKNTVIRKKGSEGADILMNTVEMKVEQTPRHLKRVLRLMKKLEDLETISHRIGRQISRSQRSSHLLLGSNMTSGEASSNVA